VVEGDEAAPGEERLAARLVREPVERALAVGDRERALAEPARRVREDAPHGHAEALGPGDRPVEVEVVGRRGRREVAVELEPVRDHHDLVTPLDPLEALERVDEAEKRRRSLIDPLEGHPNRIGRLLEVRRERLLDLQARAAQISDHHLRALGQTDDELLDRVELVPDARVEPVLDEDRHVDRRLGGPLHADDLEPVLSFVDGEVGGVELRSPALVRVDRHGHRLHAPLALGLAAGRGNAAACGDCERARERERRKPTHLLVAFHRCLSSLLRPAAPDD
jgi:hypothetical protein